jgi:hypothetical protein
LKCPECSTQCRMDGGREAAQGYRGDEEWGAVG